MSKWEKLLDRVLEMSSDIRFDELVKILETYGYEMNSPKSGSSHFTFRKKGNPPITIPKHRTVKKIYIEMVREVVIREEGADENN